jgi:selenocysteine lyase/cysteine desulfurase
VRGLPAQLRASIGLQTTHADIDRFIATLQTIVASVRR